MTHFMVHHFVVGTLDGPEREARQRLMVNSYLEDGAFSRRVFESVFESVFPRFKACLDAAAKAGHLVPGPVDPGNGFWFGHHVAAMVACTRLPGQPALAYRGSVEDLVGQAVWFILRGLGLKDDIIADLYNPKALSLFLTPPASGVSGAAADAEPPERPGRRNPSRNIPGRGAWKRGK
jgi:hypothetical protein